MTFDLLGIALICLIYIGVLFGIAYATEKGWIPNRIVSHPITYIFSLGIFASAWSFYGIIHLAQEFGYGALAYYIGTGALFLFAPYALKPLIEVARRFQINSMADLLTFRYHSHSVGGIVTMCMILAMTPLMALQIQAVADTIAIITQYNNSNNGQLGVFDSRVIFALLYCTVVICFTMLFGSNREHHKGLITAMAFESLIKLFGLCAIGFFSMFYVFSGPQDLDLWLQANPEQVTRLYTPIKETSTHTLMLLFLATAVSMPHIFHMTVVENPVKHATRTVTWAFPLFLFFMALPVFPILWAGVKLGSQLPAQYFPIAVPLAAGNSTFTVIAFVGGLSAATGAVVSISLSVATMIMNHWILPATPLRTKKEIYGQLITIRRVLIAVVVMTGYAFYLSLDNQFNLTDLALAAFIATLQLLPGVVAVTNWTQGNSKGFNAGLCIGMAVWLFAILIPMLFGFSEHRIELLGIAFDIGISHWDTVTIYAIGLNTVTFVVVSSLTKQSDAERYSAELCSEDELSHPFRLTLDIRSPEEIINRLRVRIGESTARKEVERALQKLGLNPNERRPYALRRLRDEIEANLSGLLGISMATEIMDKQIPFKVPDSDAETATDITLIENRLNHYRDEFTGLAAELNDLRLYHRRTLEELPLAVCSIGKDMEVLMWNSAMRYLTGIKSETVTGSRLEEVLEPWGEVLNNFATSDIPHRYKLEIELAGKSHWISLHKSTIPSSLAHKLDGQVILLEDVTELQLLENELIHSERLASVGRLAAGVAHEIGNPVTGIACLAQNMKYDTDNEEVLESAEQILSQTARVTRIVQSLVSFSHSGQHTENIQQTFLLRECAQEAINLLMLQIEKHEIHYQNDLPETLAIHGDSQRLIQVFVNLLSNARDASEAGTSIIISGRKLADQVEFSVSDEGPGIPQEIQDRIFEPFFTTKEPGQGTGLGLAMVYNIVDEHKGDLDIISPCHPETQTGTKFVIKMPAPLATAKMPGNTIG
ncbi:MAG: histidine kinase [Alteromonadaceae bacterium]|nr:MAG: histidine kinase [Alteromonadaceae bacterium]